LLSCGEDKGNNSQNRGTWQITIGGDEFDEGFDVIAGENGDYVVAGATSSQGAGSYDMYVIRINSTGQVMWDRAFGGAETDRAYSLTTTQDGDILAAGETSSLGDGFSSIYLVKMTATGALIWDKTYGGSGFDDCFALQPVPGGGFLLGGSSGKSAPYVVKTDEAGSVVWETRITESSTSGATSVIPHAGGESTIAGWVLNSGSRREDIMLWQLGAQGNLVSSHSFGDAGDDMCNAILPTSDDCYLLVGWTTSFGAGGQDVYVMKVDSLWHAEWSKTYGGTESDGASAVVATPDGGYVLAGWTASTGAGGNDAYLVKIDSEGTLVWQRTFGGTDDDRAQAVTNADDGGLVVVGSTRSLGAGKTDVYVIKTTENGEL
jgi:uncharacterized delta-60 repeat protein